MGAQLDRLRYEVFQNLFYSPMDTGFLRSAVATVLTVYGIETFLINVCLLQKNSLQQCLPFTVLKLPKTMDMSSSYCVATVLTVYGIETPIYR